MRGIAAYGVYVPYWRLDRKALAAAPDAHGTPLADHSDIRKGLPGSADKPEHGDGAVAYLYGAHSRDSPVRAEPVDSESATAEYLERCRLPEEPASRQWEEHFSEHV